MKCKICKEKAIIKLKRHNIKLCKEHFNDFFLKQVDRAIKEFKMFKKEEKVMVCVSGGKDSLVLWYVLKKLGYNTVGMYVNLGISEYSENSKKKVLKFAKLFDLEYKIVDLVELGYPVPKIAKESRRAECSVCGVIKRYYFNKVAYDEGFDVVATGHNLDDEASRLLGNILHWNDEYLKKQVPVLPAEGKMLKKKVKPLIRLTEKEIASYAFLNKIDYLIEECPLSKGATSLVYKDALNLIEENIVGTKQFFYFQYVKKLQKELEHSQNKIGSLKECKICGMESFNDICSFCRLVRNEEQ
ncbi:ATP-binding protein [Deferribacter abyssi]|uniref:ATP-binding protein n=1 Tax=Deferribacter abyssi TaxID=213806 RepID=UPI003C1C3CC0